MTYFKNRQNPLRELPIEELETALKAVCDCFDEEWLQNEKGAHRLQRLWTRRDALATNELFTFGLALTRLGKIDSKWLDHQIKLIKGRDENNQNGAIFEIIAANYFCQNGQVVVPANINQKGYDIDVDIANSVQWRVSLKAYAESIHEKLFRKKMEVIRQKIVSLLISKRLNVQVFIAASTYPTESNWQKLISSLHNLISHYNGNSFTTIVDTWSIAILPLLPSGGETLAKSHISHTVIGVAPYHQNEQDNFLSKLDSAVSNLARHVTSQSGRHAFIFLRLPPTASAVTLKGWVDDYFNANLSSVLDGVIFLQPYLSFNSETSGIAHFSTCSLSASYRASEKPLVHLEIPVGTVTSTPPLWELHADKNENILEGRYIFQQGQHFTLMRPTASGQKGNIVRKAPGIHTHLVLEDRPEVPTITGRWGEELFLIGG